MAHRVVVKQTEDLQALIRQMEEASPEDERDLLRHLCPCRSRVYEPEVWLRIFNACDAGDPLVRHQAKHAVETLWARANGSPPDARAQGIFQQMSELGYAWPPQPEVEPRSEKIAPGELPRLLQALRGEDPDAKARALRLLCPCRNRRYDREVWLAIMEAYEDASTGRERDQAGHAVGTLLERARIDPRSQELLCWLAQQREWSLPLEDAIPTWKRRPAGGPFVPPYERPRRSRSNRRR